MKKLFSLCLISWSFLIGSNPIKADEAYVFNLSSEGYSGVDTYEFFKTVRAGNSYTLEILTTLSAAGINLDDSASGYDQSTNELWMFDLTSDNYKIYSITNNSWSEGTVSTETKDSTPNYYVIDGVSKRTGITTNTSNISSNDTDIASNASSISTNSSNISSNDTDIASNASSISTNSSNISSNDTDIASNTSSITTNSSNISSNDTDIASNASSISTNSSNISSNDTDISALQGLISTKSGSTTTARIGDSTKNTLEIGPTTNPITINQSGISVSGGNLIKKDSDGNIHIGKNSFVIGDDVLNGAHPIWAEDENGNKIPINIYGSKLLIDGVEVTPTGTIPQVTTNKNNISTNSSNIKNLGEGVAGSTALTAALTALPQTSKESKLSCGVGTGAYSSRYAVGFGCASKVNKRVDINAGGSYVFGGSKSYGAGTLDSGVVKAGFVFKLGELNKSQKISKTEKENLESKIGSLEEKNKQLLARLERLEKIALGDLKSKDLAVYKLQ
ncbi:MAG: YadA-like family protein [Prochlorococcus marinus XMU1429]|nr:YadA-like family protein [Prochlorococcus marinus XMU1429]